MPQKFGYIGHELIGPGYKLIAFKLLVTSSFDHSEIINLYNAVIKGIVDYYTFADDYTTLEKITGYLL